MKKSKKERFEKEGVQKRKRRVPHRPGVLAHFGCCLAVCASLLLTACGKADGSGDGVMPKGNNVSHEAQEKEWVYVPEVIRVGDESADYGKMQIVGDSFCYVSRRGEDGSGEKSICRYSLTGQELARVPLDWPQGGENWEVGAWSFSQEGSLYLIANVYPADYSRLDRFLCRFDGEGNCEFSQDITERVGKEVSLDRLTADGQGRLYLFAGNGEILLYTGDGDYRGSVSYGASDTEAFVQVKGACEGADGKYYVCIGKGSAALPGEKGRGADAAGDTVGKDIQCYLAEIDFEGAKLREVSGELPDINGLCAGKWVQGASGIQYDFLLYDDRAVYGYNMSTQKGNSGLAGEKLFTWMDSDINGYCVANLYLLADGRLYAMAEDWENDDRAVVALTATKAEQAPQREELVLATVAGESNLSAMAVKFNRGNSRYHLTVVKYESLTDLYNAVLAKDSLDLVDLSGIHADLAAQGFFEDLSPYMEKSERFSASDFVDGILEVYTFQNALIGIPASFTLTTVVGKGAQTADSGLTLEALLADADSHPEAAAFDGVTKEEMMRYLMLFNEDTFIDWESGVCHFDSESFQAVLEYVSRFPDSVESGEEEASLPAKIKSGEVRFAIAKLDDLKAFQQYADMFGGTAACVGFPTPDGRGGHLLFTGDAYGIAAVSEHKEGAWKFIEDFLAEEKSESYYSASDSFSVSFPTLKKTLNEKVEERMEEDSQIRSDRFPELIYSDGTTFQYHALTWEEVNVMLDLIPEAKPFFSSEGDEIFTIIMEEAYAYYSGQKSAQDVAGVIQNRAQLYVSENGGT